jgi:Berberine and berberine like
VWFTVLAVSWAPFDEVERKREQSLVTNTYIAALRKLTPDMGAYVNEVFSPSTPTTLFVILWLRQPTILCYPNHQLTALPQADFNEPNFQNAFWGTNYPRLLSIKRAVDPHDVLWCHPCVGNERWEVVGDQLCRVSNGN